MVLDVDTLTTAMTPTLHVISSVDATATSSATAQPSQFTSTQRHYRLAAYESYSDNSASQCLATEPD